MPVTNCTAATCLVRVRRRPLSPSYSLCLRELQHRWVQSTPERTHTALAEVRAAEELTARELDAEIRRLTDVARQGKTTPTELGSGTFTLNNYRVFGVDGSAAIINHPEVAILGVGRHRKPEHPPRRFLTQTLFHLMWV